MLNLTPTDRPGLFLDSESQVKATNWGTTRKGEKGDWRSSEEQNVIFDNGELLSGILDKAQIGPSANGMVHSVYEIYGPDVAGKLLSALGRLFTKYSQMQGLSCGMEDLRLTEQGRETRKRVLAEEAGVGREVAIEYVGLKDAYDETLFRERMEEVIRDAEKLGGLDRAMQGAASKLTSVMYRELVPVHLIKKFPKNNMQNMTESKAKGGSDNANLISSIIGIVSYVDGAYGRTTVFGRRPSTYNGERQDTPLISCIRHRHTSGRLCHVMLPDWHQTARIFLLLHGWKGRTYRHCGQDFSLGILATVPCQTSRGDYGAIRQFGTRSRRIFNTVSLWRRRS